jgi:hypothetical protein
MTFTRTALSQGYDSEIETYFTDMGVDITEYDYLVLDFWVISADITAGDGRQGSKFRLTEDERAWTQAFYTYLRKAAPLPYTYVTAKGYRKKGLASTVSPTFRWRRRYFGRAARMVQVVLRPYQADESFTWNESPYNSRTMPGAGPVIAETGELAGGRG